MLHSIAKLLKKSTLFLKTPRISMDVKIRHKLIKIEDRVSDRFVILITNNRWLRVLEVIRYR